MLDYLFSYDKNFNLLVLMSIFCTFTEIDKIFVNGQNGHFEFNFVAKFQADHFDCEKFGFWK